jgi:hypothetical protein
MFGQKAPGRLCVKCHAFSLSGSTVKTIGREQAMGRASRLVPEPPNDPDDRNARPGRDDEPWPGSRAARLKLPRAIDTLKTLALEYGVCVRPVTLRRTDLVTG